VDRLRDETALWHDLLKVLGQNHNTHEAVMLALRPEELENIISRPPASLDPERERLLNVLIRCLETVEQHEADEAFYELNTAIRARFAHLGALPAAQLDYQRSNDGAGHGNAQNDNTAPF
jgi:hypothetical protein